MDWKELFRIQDGYIRFVCALRQDKGLQVSTSSPKQVTEAICSGLVVRPLKEEEKRKIDRALAILDERSADVLRRYYGINCERETLASIARHRGLSRGYIGQIRDEALRQLRHTEEGWAVMPILWYWGQFADEVERLRSQLRIFRNDLRALADELDAQSSPVFRQLSREERMTVLKHRRIERCKLSNRVKNVCSAQGIMTLGDFYRFDELSLLEFRNFGKSCLAEVNAFLASLGLPSIPKSSISF